MYQDRDVFLARGRRKWRLQVLVQGQSRRHEGKMEPCTGLEGDVRRQGEGCARAHDSVLGIGAVLLYHTVQSGDTVTLLIPEDIGTDSLKLLALDSSRDLAIYKRTDRRYEGLSTA